jgi:hypothetical protein
VSSQLERAQGGRAEVGGGDHVSRSPLVKLLDDLRPEELQTHLVRAPDTPTLAITSLHALTGKLNVCTWLRNI